jgi:hypothetical protein
MEAFLPNASYRIVMRGVGGDAVDICVVLEVLA